MIRGRITALNGVTSENAHVAPDAKWALNGDRGITYAATPPPGTVITEGQWWPANYNGPTLISLDQAIAKGTGLKIGDTMTLNVLGRELRRPHRHPCAKWISPPAGRISCWCCLRA